MNAHSPALPAMVPSRVDGLSRATTALRHGHPVLITGAPGSGRTIFGQSLLETRAREGRSVHRISGSRALADMQFAALAALAAQMPGVIDPHSAPTETITAMATQALSTPRTFFIDHAEDIDPASGAAIAQLHPGVELIIATTKLTELPPDLARLAYEHGVYHAELAPLTLDDARVLLEDLLHAPCNSSTVNRLFNLSGGNPMYLRELAFEADQRGALQVLHGYRTLDAGWAPTSLRVIDLITMRLADQRDSIREAVHLIAVTGPLSRSLLLLLVTPEVLDAALAEGLLTVSTRNQKTDIAQSFDGPGATQTLERPEELVQLGAGLTSDLILPSLRPATLRTYRDRIRERITEALLTTATHVHMRAAFRVLSDSSPAVTGTADPATDALTEVATRIVSLTHGGRPTDGIAVFAEHVDTGLWHAASSDAQTACIQAMFLAMMGEGSRPDVFDEHFTSIDWHDVALDHGVFLTGRGDLFLELGDATEAGELFAQALGLLSMHDRTGLAGFASGLDAVAACMLGDLERARMQYNRFIVAGASSGGLARSEVERLRMLVELTLEGPEIAKATLEALIEQAAVADHPFLTMRLLHDAWRLRLVADDEAQAHLEKLAAVAEKVQGHFASILGQYAPAFRELTSGSPAAESPDAPSVESIIVAHLESGRALFAAEVAARSAALASQAGDRKRAASLLALFAQATPTLTGVITPSLGRVRIDPDLLSEREVEVCLAAVDGKTNPEIAAELFLSPRTVEGHLQRSYSKLGITDRRQLLPLGNSSVNAS